MECPQEAAYLDKHQRKVDPGALTCVLGGGNSPIEELLAGIHPLKDARHSAGQNFL